MVFPGPFDFGHDLSGHLSTGAGESDGGFFGWFCRENRDEVLRGRLVAYGHEKKRERAEEQHDTVHEAFDEITQHLVEFRLGAKGKRPQFSATIVRTRDVGERTCSKVDLSCAMP